LEVEKVEKIGKGLREGRGGMGEGEWRVELGLS